MLYREYVYRAVQSETNVIELTEHTKYQVGMKMCILLVNVIKQCL